MEKKTFVELNIKIPEELYISILGLNNDVENFIIEILKQRVEQDEMEQQANSCVFSKMQDNDLLENDDNWEKL